MVLGIYCPLINTRIKLVDFFKRIYEDQLVICSTVRIVTKFGLIIVLIRNEADTCGLRLDHYCCINGEENCPMLDRIKVCLMN